MNTRRIRNNNYLYVRLLLFFSCIINIICLDAMSEKKNTLSLQKQLYSHLKQISIDEKIRNRMKVFMHSNSVMHDKKDEDYQLMVHNKTANTLDNRSENQKRMQEQLDILNQKYPLLGKVDEKGNLYFTTTENTLQYDNSHLNGFDKNDPNFQAKRTALLQGQPHNSNIGSGDKILEVDFSGILDIPKKLNNVVIDQLDNVFNSEEKRQKAEDALKRDQAYKRQELYPHVSANIHFNPDKDYTNCKYTPHNTKLAKGYENCVLDIDQLNKNKEYEAGHQHWIQEAAIDYTTYCENLKKDFPSGTLVGPQTDGSNLISKNQNNTSEQIARGDQSKSAQSSNSLKLTKYRLDSPNKFVLVYPYNDKDSRRFDYGITLGDKIRIRSGIIASHINPNGNFQKIDPQELKPIHCDTIPPVEPKEQKIPDQKDSKGFIEQASEGLDLANNTIKSVKTLVNTGREISSWITSNSSHDSEKTFKELREEVENNFKLNGYYLEKEHLKKLTTLLATNKIEVSSEVLQRLQRQYAINLLRYSSYLEGDYEKLCTDLWSDEPNKDVIKNMDDVFASALKRGKKVLLNKIMRNTISKYDAAILLRGFEQGQNLNTGKSLCIDTSPEFNKQYSTAYARELEKRRKEHEYQQQAIAQEIFNEQVSDLKQYASEWENSNSERFKAYMQVVEDKANYTKNSYSLSSQAQSCLSNNGLNPKNYALLYGNQLQQRLFSEIISGIEKISHIPISEKFSSMIQSAALSTLDGARQVNEIGDCLGASKLVDLATTMADYCSAFAEGLLDGVIEGVVDGAKGTYEMVRYPIKTAQSLKKIALQLATVIDDYIPFYKPLWLCSTEEEWKKSFQEYERISKNWDDANEKISKWWCETPTREKIYEITKGGTSAATNVIVGNKCLNLAGQICSNAVKEALVLCEKTKVEFVGIPLELSSEVFKDMSKAEQITHAPNTVLLSEVKESLNPAHSVVQYERLKKVLNEEQYTSITKCTQHGLERLMERFNPEELSAILNTPDFIKIQNDGAQVFIKKFGDKYAVISINPEVNEVITGINKISLGAVKNLGKNYGWTLE